jgi:carbon monoxide dehydrogenase subunit G
MELEHHFAVPASVEETWAAFNDPERVAPCFPGATLISVNGDEFTGSVKIKLGPIALQYNGVGTYVQRDESAHRAVIVAKGKDKRGNGTANATVTAQLAAGGERTAVHVTTDLVVTGKPAQFGRGVMQDVSDNLLQQFVACLETTLGAPEAQEKPPEVPVAEVPVAEVPVAEVPVAEVPPAEVPPAEVPVAEVPAAEVPAAEVPATVPAGDAQLDLLRTVGRVLLSRYAARVLGPVAFLVGYLLGRRSRR